MAANAIKKLEQEQRKLDRQLARLHERRRKAVEKFVQEEGDLQSQIAKVGEKLAEERRKGATRGT